MSVKNTSFLPAPELKGFIASYVIQEVPDGVNEPFFSPPLAMSGFIITVTNSTGILNAKIDNRDFITDNAVATGQVSTNYQLTYSFDKALVISNTYSITTGFFATINEVDGAIAYFVPQNMQNTTNYAVSISYPLQIAKWWEASYFVTYSRRTYDGNFAEATIDLDANIYSATTQNSFKLPLGLTMDLSVFYNSPWIWRGSVEVGAYSGVDIGLKKMFLNDKLQLIVNANDIFNGYTNYPYSGEYGGMTMQGIRSFDNQRIGFSLTYKFGNQNIKSRKRKGGLDDELNRISD